MKLLKGLFSLLLVGGMLTANQLAAQAASAGVTAPAIAGARLKMVVVLSRHGVRSPTWTSDRLDAYSAQPWSAWSVPPGDLTARGFDLLRKFGSYDRATLAAAGLFAAHGCGGAASTYIWADTDQRTMASGRALAQGLFPGCAPAMHSLATGEEDPLFHPAMSALDATAAEGAFAQLSRRVADLPLNPANNLLQQIQAILFGCKPEAECSPSHAPAMRLLDGRTVVTHGNAGKLPGLKGPIPTGSSLAEDLLLEYADGMPMSTVGWGNVDEAEIRRLLTLHTIYFDLVHRTPEFARLEASNMVAVIADTLEQGVEDKAVSGAKGKPGDKLVLLVGHDSNIASVASLLGLHWTLDGRSDDTPPGIELMFELWRNPQGTYFVRIDVAMQTLHQLRADSDLTLDSPPAHQEVELQECGAEARECSWKSFQKITAIAIDKKYVSSEKPLAQ